MHTGKGECVERIEGRDDGLTAVATPAPVVVLAPRLNRMVWE